MVHAERYVCELCHVYENGAADLFFFSVVLHFKTSLLTVFTKGLYSI